MFNGPPTIILTIDMKIKKTLFTTEIEISVDEVRDSYEKIHPDTMFFDLLMKFLTKLTN